MNLFANNTGRETIKQPTQPELARQALDDRAVENVQAALQRQFPGMSFGVPAPVVMAESAPVAQQVVEEAEQIAAHASQNPIDASLNGARDEFTQAA